MKEKLIKKGDDKMKVKEVIEAYVKDYEIHSSTGQCVKRSTYLDELRVSRLDHMKGKLIITIDKTRPEIYSGELREAIYKFLSSEADMSTRLKDSLTDALEELEDDL